MYDHEARDLLGPGFFILEVKIRQGVFVTATNPLAVEEVANIVELGFNRQAGGRLKFRALLRAKPAFRSLLNVEVLDQMSPPQSSPSYAPSSMPSLITMVPTFQPTLRVLGPTAAPRSVMTTLVPSSNQVNREPSASPHSLTFEKEEPRNTRPERLNQILWGIGIGLLFLSILVFLCIIRRYCLSTRKMKSRRTHRGEAAPIPVVQLDDAESLADTTLGDMTAGGVGYVSPFSTAPIPFRKSYAQRMRQMEFPSLLKPPMKDSFEESSLYTSAIPVNSANSGNFRVTATTALVVLPSSGEGKWIGQQDLGLVPQGSTSSQLGMELVPFERKSKTLRSLVGEDSVEDLDQSFFFDEVKEDTSTFSDLAIDNAAKAKFISEQIDSGTKGFDPFYEDQTNSSRDASSRDSSHLETKGFNPFEDDNTTSSPIESDSTKSGSQTPSIVISSSSGSAELEPTLTLSEDTAKAENLLSGCMTTCRSVASDSSSQLHHATSLENSGSFLRSETKRTPSVSSGYVNNSLLRTVLEGASRLAEAASSNRSWTSRKTAPPRMDTMQSLVAGKVRSNNASVAFNDFDESRSLVSPRESDTNFRTPARYGSGRRDDITENSTQNTTPYSESSGLPSPVGTLGAEPRDGSWDAIVSDSEPNTPVSTPGVLGIKRNNTVPSLLHHTSSEADEPWLQTKVEQTLGPKSLYADTDAISVRSNRSVQSFRSDPSFSGFTGTGVPPSPASVRSHRERTSFRSRNSSANRKQEGSHQHAKVQKTDSSILPRSLDNELAKLEKQLGSRPSQRTSTSVTSKGSSKTKRVKRDRVRIVVPPGKLGVVLANRNDGNGTVVSEVRPSSMIHGVIQPGDILGKYIGATSMMINEMFLIS